MRAFKFLVQDSKLSISDWDSKGRTPLHYAFRTRNFVLIDALIEETGKENAKKLILLQDENRNTAVGCLVKSLNSDNEVS